MSNWELCPGSEQDQVVDWQRTEDYAGASVCIHCSFGVLLKKNKRIYVSISGAGYECNFGTLRKHYVNHKTERMSYNKKEK